VGQQALESFHFPSFAFLLCLHNTRLEPPHFSVDFLPVNGIPVLLVVGNRTSMVFCFQWFRCRHLLVSFGGSSNSLVMKDRMEVCSLSRGVILSGDATPVCPITGQLSLFPSSFARHPMGFLYRWLSQSWEDDKLTVFRIDN
jgi:hypothetical protein